MLVLTSGPVVAQSAARSDVPHSATADQRTVRDRSRQPKTILLVRTAGDEAITKAVRVELLGRGWRIVDVRLKGTSAAADPLSQLVAEQSVTAALRVNSAKGEIELCVARASGDIQEMLRNQGDSSDSQILALRVTETLRAHGLDLGRDVDDAAADFNSTVSRTPTSSDLARSQRVQTRDAHASQGSPAAPDVASELGSSVRSRSLWFELGPALLESAGGWRTDVASWLGLKLELSPRWSVSASGVVPWTSQSVAAAEGRAAVKTGLLGASTAATLLRGSFGESSVGVGAAILVTTMRGSAQAGYLDRSEVVVTPAPYATLRAVAVLHRSWQCFSVALAGVSIPEVSVAFADRTVKTWGSPFALVGFGIEARAVRW